jgi:hypothetical protein
MTKKNASTVSVMAIRQNPNAWVLHSFNLTIEEYLGLKLCAPGIRPSECTPNQRLILRQLKERRLVKVIEHPHLFEGLGWVPDNLGEAYLEACALLLTADIQSGPAKVTAIPVRSTRSRR